MSVGLLHVNFAALNSTSGEGASVWADLGEKT